MPILKKNPGRKELAKVARLLTLCDLQRKGTDKGIFGTVMEHNDFKLYHWRHILRACYLLDFKVKKSANYIVDDNGNHIKIVDFENI